MLALIDTITGFAIRVGGGASTQKRAFFNQVHREAVLRQRNCRGDAGNAAADNGNGSALVQRV